MWNILRRSIQTGIGWREIGNEEQAFNIASTIITRNGTNMGIVVDFEGRVNADSRTLGIGRSQSRIAERKNKGII